MLRTCFLIAVLLLFFISACGSSAAGAGYTRITPREAEEMMAGDVIILDVRTMREFENGHIRGAVLLTYDEIWRYAEAIIPDREQIILVYCQAGRRSEIAARALIDMGFTNVFDFGGILDWHGEVVGDDSDRGMLYERFLRDYCYRPRGRDEVAAACGFS